MEYTYPELLSLLTKLSVILLRTAFFYNMCFIVLTVWGLLYNNGRNALLNVWWMISLVLWSEFIVMETRCRWRTKSFLWLCLVLYSQRWYSDTGGVRAAEREEDPSIFSCLHKNTVRSDFESDLVPKKYQNISFYGDKVIF